MSGFEWLLMRRDTKEEEKELFVNESIRIAIVLKKQEWIGVVIHRFDNPNLFNILCRFYTLGDEITEFSATVRETIGYKQ